MTSLMAGAEEGRAADDHMSWICRNPRHVTISGDKPLGLTTICHSGHPLGHENTVFSSSCKWLFSSVASNLPSVTCILFF